MVFYGIVFTLWVAVTREVDFIEIEIIFFFSVGKRMSNPSKRKGQE